MREPEGIETPLPGKSSERSWSKRREPDIRNVEAVGSNPITSTIHLVGSPRESSFCWTFASTSRVIHRVYGRISRRGDQNCPMFLQVDSPSARPAQG